MCVDIFHQTDYKIYFSKTTTTKKSNYKNDGSFDQNLPGFDNRYIDNKAKRNSRQTPFYPAVTSRKLLIDFFLDIYSAD